jgi:hypothetical protein
MTVHLANGFIVGATFDVALLELTVGFFTDAVADWLQLDVLDANYLSLFLQEYFIEV